MAPKKPAKKTAAARTRKTDPVAALQKDVAILKAIVSQALGVTFADFDPEAIAAKNEALAKEAETMAKAEAAAQAKIDARVAAQQEAAAAAEAKIQARAQAILEQAGK